MALPDAQIAGAAKAAGFSGTNLAKAVAIALAESGGNPNAHNGKAPDNSYGLWQINMIGSLGPARRKQFGLSSNNALFDPQVNARAAYAIAGGGKTFRPWTTYTSGAYLRFMSRANTAAGNPSSAGAQQVGLSDGLSAVTEFFEFLSDPITWLRLGMILAGAILVALALMSAGGVAGKAKQLAGVLPQGKILKAATAKAG